MDDLKVFLFGLLYGTTVLLIACAWAYVAFGEWILFLIG